MGAGTNAGGELSVEELKVALEQLRAENRRLAEENGLLRGDDASWNDVKAARQEAGTEGNRVEVRSRHGYAASRTCFV